MDERFRRVEQIEQRLRLLEVAASRQSLRELMDIVGKQAQERGFTTERRMSLLTLEGRVIVPSTCYTPAVVMPVERERGAARGHLHQRLSASVSWQEHVRLTAR